MAEKIEFTKAERKAVSVMLSISGTSGSGKTFSSLLLAAGLAPNKKVCMIDTESGRGSMYADQPLITDALPEGYDIIEMNPPFSPSRYLQYILAASKAGYEVCIVDSFSHEWEGTGGCQDIAENNLLGGQPNWAKAKKQHKNLVDEVLRIKDMYIIFNLRAREKVKVHKVDGKIVIEDVGLQPITEKNFVFEMMFSLLMDEKTKKPQILKCPGSLEHIFDENKYITPSIGESILEWAHGGTPIDPQLEAIKNAAIQAAQGGNVALDDWVKKQTTETKIKLKPFGAEIRSIADEIDRQNPPQEQSEKTDDEGLGL